MKKTVRLDTNSYNIQSVFWILKSIWIISCVSCLIALEFLERDETTLCANIMNSKVGGIFWGNYVISHHAFSQFAEIC